mgnify:FL=1
MFINGGFLCSKTMLNIAITEIVMIKGMGNYSVIIKYNGQSITSSRTLKVFEELLTGFSFVRPSKFCIVNLNYVVRPSKFAISQLEVKSIHEKIPISRRRQAEVNQILRNQKN